jgi:peptidylprolyl isomerase
MTPGEKRTVILPPELAYGERGLSQGQTTVIPPNSFVIFDIELVRVK